MSIRTTSLSDLQLAKYSSNAYEGKNYGKSVPGTGFELFAAVTDSDNSNDKTRCI